jgi:NTE family protein
MKLGIVLSGGGAKGAYEAGFLKALAEFNVQRNVISGTSIGAITGAICSANKDIKKSAEIIEKLWLELAEESALKVDDKFIKRTIIDVMTFFGPLPETKLIKFINLLTKNVSSDGVFSNLPLINRLQLYAPVEKLKDGLPFYVAFTKSYGNTIDLLHFFNLKSVDVEYTKIQSLDDEEIYKAIMASAALPILFEAIKVNGEIKRDGCLGSQSEEMGNTPAKPLVELEKCSHLIICHLNKGSVFNRLNPIFKDIPIIEIRPNEKIFNNLLDPLYFKIDKIKEWMEAGYLDTKKILTDSFETLNLIKERKVTEYFSNKSVNKLKNRNFKLDFE